jgi:hypothetical protein
MDGTVSGRADRPAESLRVRLRPAPLRSGDWDYNPKVAANVLNSLVEYTSIPVHPDEVVITADSKDHGDLAGNWKPVTGNYFRSDVPG